MELLRLVGLCILCMGPLVLLRKSAPEQALLLTLAVFCVGTLWCISLAAPLVSALRELGERAGLGGKHLDVLLKAVGTALVTRVGSDLCRDGGSQTMAGLVELLGAVAALIVAMPLIREVLELLGGYFG